MKPPQNSGFQALVARVTQSLACIILVQHVEEMAKLSSDPMFFLDGPMAVRGTKDCSTHEVNTAHHLQAEVS